VALLGLHVFTIDEKTVRHIANLARLSVSDEEVARYASQLARILDYAQQLEELSTDAVPPTAHSLSVNNVFRLDQPHASWPAEKALANAPDPHDGFFRVPKVLDQEDA
jgi:aspartyl-tRNA(Asn)/glutamyl-tRNA(Gln) amidotransferase subunit C